MGNGENIYGGSEEAEISQLVSVKVLGDGEFGLVDCDMSVDPDSELVKKSYAGLDVGTVFQAAISSNGRFVRPEDLKSESVSVPLEGNLSVNIDKGKGVVVVGGYYAKDTLLCGPQNGEVRDLLSNLDV